MASVNELRVIAHEIDTLFQYKAFKIVNDLLLKANARLPLMDSDKIILYARVTSCAKAELPAWELFIESAYKEFKNRHLDVDSLTNGTELLYR